MTMQAPPGFFSGTNNLDPSSKLPFFPPNFVGRVRIDSCKGITTRAGERAFIAELTVLTSNMADVFIGGRYSWYQGMKEPGTAYPACIGFLYAALGLDPNRDKVEIETKVKPNQDHLLNAAVSDKNPLANKEVMLQTAAKLTKAKTQFTLHTFAPAAKAA